MTSEIPSHPMIIHQASQKQGQTNISVAMTLNALVPGDYSFTFRFKLAPESDVAVSKHSTTSPSTNSASVLPAPITPVRPCRQEEFSPTQPDPDYTRYWEEDRRRRQREAAGIISESDTENLAHLAEPLSATMSRNTAEDTTQAAAMNDDERDRDEDIVPDSQDEENYILPYPGSPINLGKCWKTRDVSKSPSEQVKRAKRRFL
ncbi:uncharacterized protein ARMOST_20651 [Armillaria ostoyae]|uniref:Uncharacterized protein n=1 Tax=Armillaria ostoyae TaxID=47428 RepID=A0A284S7X1_ARMOS|nr:uncharacterized protein ARMOST_09382 [Armillaria ostoyae]SJL17109.1 uncharacterized protein ARMOST_20651 [Armillaria ostoyae]